MTDELFKQRQILIHHRDQISAAVAAFRSQCIAFADKENCLFCAELQGAFQLGQSLLDSVDSAIDDCVEGDDLDVPL